MALAAAIGILRRKQQATVTNFAEIINARDDWRDGQLVSPSSWSCAHGIERWRSNCSCGATHESGRAQEWRGRLRAALRWLADALEAGFVARLIHANCNDRSLGNGAHLWYRAFHHLIVAA